MCRSSYDAAYYQIPILVYAAMFSGLSANVGSVYIAYKKTREISYTTMMTAVINVIVHLGLIKFVGLYAASISTLVAFCSMFIYRLYKIKDTEPIRFNIRAILPQIPFSMFVLTSYYSRRIWIQIIAFVLLCLYALYYLLNEKTFRSQLVDLMRRFHKN